MNFDVDKALRYDPKGVMHQRRLNMSFKGYEAEHDEVLAPLANTDLFEKTEVDDRSSNDSERINQERTTSKQTEVPTPLKAEKSLKRHFANTMDMDEDVATKRPRISEQSKDIVNINDDD